MVSAHSHRVSRVPWYSGSCRAGSDFGYGALTLSGRLFQSRSPVFAGSLVAVRTPRCTHHGLGSSAFARRYSRNRCFFLFLRVLRCFSSPGCLLHGYVFTVRRPGITLSGFPHSDICGLTDICSSPQLFAACHVLLRLPVPRHPPYALLHLTK